MLQPPHLLVERVIHDASLSACREHLCRALEVLEGAGKTSRFPLSGERKTLSDALKITARIFSKEHDLISENVLAFLSLSVVFHETHFNGWN